MKIVEGTPCLITGASSGIGRAIALALGRRRCRVALIARSEGALSELAAEIDAAGGEALPLPADVTSEEQVGAAVAAAAERFGGLKLAVANAGVGRYARVEEQPAEHVEATIGTNYVGLARTVRHALPHLLAATPSHLVGVASSAGIIPHRTASAYCASKAASIAYLSALRIEVKGRGVGVTWVCPGVVTTPFIERADLDPKRDLPRLNNLTVRTLDVDEVARKTVRAVERDRREVVLPGMMRVWVVVRRMAPSLGDWVQRVSG